MKQKLLFQSVFLVVLLCIFFSQTPLASNIVRAAKKAVQDIEEQAAGDTIDTGTGQVDANMAAAGAGTNGADTAGAGTGTTDIAIAGEGTMTPAEEIAETGAIDPATGLPAAEAAPEGAQITMPVMADGSLPDLSGEMATVSANATPDPLMNFAAGSGEYTLSLTSSIGTLTYYNQSDARWANYLYGGSDPLAAYGCGPTALAMLINSFTETTCQPPDIAAWAAANNYWSAGYGTKHEFVPDCANAFGMHAASFQNYTVEGLMAELRSGHVIVALMGPGHFSDSGHFIIITDDWSGNQVRVADPARLERTQMAWDAQIILDEMLVGASGGGPLWSVSP